VGHPSVSWKSTSRSSVGPRRRSAVAIRSWPKPPRTGWERSQPNLTRCVFDGYGTRFLILPGERFLPEEFSWILSGSPKGGQTASITLHTYGHLFPDELEAADSGVSEGGLEPPRPMRALGPQPSASAYSATPTWCTWVRADCSKGLAGGTDQAGRLMAARSRVFQGVRLKPWRPGVRTAAWCSVSRGVVVRSARMVASACW
jgi:hypothetical protein